MACSFYFRSVALAAIASLLTATFSVETSSAAEPPLPASCNQEANVIATVPAKLPASARNIQGTVTVLVELSIAPTGALQQATVFKSSGNAAMDREALRSARASEYAPKMVHCVRMQSKYLFPVVFSSSLPVAPDSAASSPQDGKCSVPFRDASVTHAVAPEYPDSARALNVGPATVLAEVTVGVDGKPVDITIYKSSGNMAMDREAIVAARASTYAPRLVNCNPVAGGQYLFRAAFNPNPQMQ